MRTKIMFVTACLCLLTACGGGGGGDESAFGPTSSLDGTSWAITSTITETTCPTEQVGTTQTGRTVAFTQSGNDLTAVFYLPEMAQTSALGGETDANLTGTRDGADFTLTGTATVVNQSGCVVSAAETVTGTIGSDGTLSGTTSGTTSPNDLTICMAVLDAAMGEQIAALIYTSCSSTSSYTATAQ